MAFAQVYTCPKCGDVWKDVEMVEVIDCERDDVECYPVCGCGQIVREKTIDGKPVWHALTEDEIIDETTDWSGDY